MISESVLQQLIKDFETAAEWLLFYEDRLKQWQRDCYVIREEINAPEIFVRTGSTGNIVMQKILSLAELDKTEQWLLTIELVQSMLGPKKKTFLAVRRAARRMNKTINGHEVWRGYAQVNYAKAMATAYRTTPDKFWLSDHTITNWWKQLVELTQKIAYKRGCEF